MSPGYDVNAENTLDYNDTGPDDRFIGIFDMATTPQTCPNNTLVPVVMTPRLRNPDQHPLDPQGWLGLGETYPSPDWSGYDYPAGSWFALTPGVYWVEGSWGWDSTGDLATGGRKVWFTDIDNRFASANFDDWYAESPSPVDSALDTPATALPGGYVGTFRGIYRVKDANDPTIFGVTAVQTSGGDLDLIGCRLGIMRLSPSGG